MQASDIDVRSKVINDDDKRCKYREQKTVK